MIIGKNKAFPLLQIMIKMLERGEVRDTYFKIKLK